MRVSSKTRLHERADLETLSEVLKFTKDLDVLHGLSVAAQPILFYLRLILGVLEENTGALLKSMVASKYLFSIAEAYLHETADSQRAWRLSSAAAVAAELHWPRSF